MIASFTLNGRVLNSQALEVEWISQACVRLEPVTSEFEAGQMCTVTATVVGHDGVPAPGRARAV